MEIINYTSPGRLEDLADALYEADVLLCEDISPTAFRFDGLHEFVKNLGRLERLLHSVGLSLAREKS